MGSDYSCLCYEKYNSDCSDCSDCSDVSDTHPKKRSPILEQNKHDSAIHKDLKKFLAEDEYKFIYAMQNESSKKLLKQNIPYIMEGKKDSIYYLIIDHQLVATVRID